ncbi:MAG: hypothetical protein QXE05_09860 [Nitrososphaeria archaeon]
MKFSEIKEPSGGFKNNSTSYFLVLDIADNPAVSSMDSIGSYSSFAGSLVDPNGVPVANFKFIFINVSSVQSTMTVWNGTSMVSEPINFIIPTVQYIARHEMLIPPGYSFNNFGYAIGFWLTFEELQEYLLKGKSDEKIRNETLENWGKIEVVEK